jgi:hypothetical protein
MAMVYNNAAKLYFIWIKHIIAANYYDKIFQANYPLK